MLHWFPTPYPDELLYSVLARYHVRSGNTSRKMTTEELFGKRTIIAVWDLPSNLNTFLRNTGDYWDADKINFQQYHVSLLLHLPASKTSRAS